MVMDIETYSSLYTNSHALVIGINNYQYTSPLSYAINDAQMTAELLIAEFGFKKECVQLLIDSDATKSRIIDSFLSYTNEVDVNDRMIFFFAGHGHTVLGRRGEVGFLVPHDGNSNKLSTLIRWDEITRDAELIPAKHILFVMDACYGGLALTRSLAPGSMRFLKDMLLRYTRQVLTAGKADEVVADSGGPISGHSIFTGHFIEALQGKAASEEGIITANGVMAYVYEKVSKDQNSHQTPHYGFFDGDGDLIFRAPILNESVEEGEKDEDTLVSVPSTMPMTNIEETGSLVDLTKEYLSDTRYTIKLDDLVKQEIRQVLLLTSDDNFIVEGTDWSAEEFTRRLKEYQLIVDNLLIISCYIAHYGKTEHLPILRKLMSRLTDRLEPKGGLIVWSALRWYPAMLLLYSAGISAIASDKYDNLSAMLLTKVVSPSSRKATTSLTLAICEPILELARHDPFKQLPGHERQYAPRSEYLFKLLQPMLDDILFLGRDYEQFFDQFEILLALVCADLRQQESPARNIWGPVGRFGWKYRSDDNNPLKELITNANKMKQAWGPLSAGLFGGDYSRFENISSEYEKMISG